MKSNYFKITHISSVQQYRQWWIGNQPSQACVLEVIMDKWFTTFWFSIWQIQTLCGLFDTTISWPLAVNTWNSNAYKHSSQKIWQNLDGSKIVGWPQVKPVTAYTSICLGCCESCVYESVRNVCDVQTVRSCWDARFFGRVRQELAVVKCVLAQSKQASLSAGGGFVFAALCPVNTVQVWPSLYPSDPVQLLTRCKRCSNAQMNHQHEWKWATGVKWPKPRVFWYFSFLFFFFVTISVSNILQITSAMTNNVYNIAVLYIHIKRCLNTKKNTNLKVLQSDTE